MKTIEKIVVFLCAYLFCGWGTLFVQNANAGSSTQELRVFAYDLNYTFEPENEETQLGTYTFTFISNVMPTEGWLIFYDKNNQELGRDELSDEEIASRTPASEYKHTVQRTSAELAQITGNTAYLDMKWGVELRGGKIIGINSEATAALNYTVNKDAAYNGTSYKGTDGEGALQAQVNEPRRHMEDNHFRCPQGIAIDNNPQSPYFGRVYVANAPTSVNTGLSSNAYAPGIVIFEPDPTTGKYHKKAVVEIESKFFNPDGTVEDKNQRYFLHRIAVNPVNGKVYICSSGSGYQSAVYQLTPTDEGLDWNGKINVTEQLITSTGFATHPLHPINSLAFGPGGELYVMSKAISGTKVNDSDSHPRGNGKIYKLTQKDEDGRYHGFEQHYNPLTTPQPVKNGKGEVVRQPKGEPFNIDPWIDSDNSMVVDARGGFWVAQERNAVDVYACLAHIHPMGYQSYSKYGKSLEPFFQFALSKVDDETFSANTLTPYSTAQQLLDPHIPGGTLNSTYTIPSGHVAIYEKNGLNSTDAFLAVGFKGRVCVFKLLYGDHGTWYGFNYDWMFEIGFSSSEYTIDGLAFDYAGNLFIASETSHKLYVYSLPNYQPMISSNSPAMQPLAFDKYDQRLMYFTNGTNKTDAWNNLNRGEPLDDNNVTTVVSDQLLISNLDNVDGAIVFNNVKDNQWSTTNNWNIKRVPEKTDIPVIVRADANITGEQGVSGLILENGSHLTIAHDGGLTVGEGGITGAADDGSSITIQNYSSKYLPDQQGAGYLRIHPDVEQQTKVTVNYITKGRPDETNPLSNNDLHWQYVGAPGEGTEITISNHTWIYKWDAANKEWDKQSGTFNLEPFEGYAITQKDMPSYTWTTTAINSAPKDGVRLQKGDNIFANSYLAPINVAAFDKDDFEEANSDEPIDKTFYIFNTGSWNKWDAAVNGGGDKALTEHQSPGQYTAITVLSAENINDNTDPTTIAPMQGVYVRTKGEGTIKLDYEKHVWKTSSPGTAPMRAPEKNVSPDLLRRIRIQAYGENSGSDRLYILQDMRCTPDYDNGYDGKNMNAAGQVNIYTNEPCGRMEISSTNQIDGMYIGFRAGPDTTYTLRFTSLIGDSLCIKDLANDSIIPLYEDSTYTFYAAAKSVNNMRFQVLLHPNPADDYSDTDDNSGTTTDVDNVSTSQLWMADQHLCISNQMANSTAKIYSVSGQLLISEKFNYQIDIPVYNLTTGVYILEVNNERYKFIRQN